MQPGQGWEGTCELSSPAGRGEGQQQAQVLLFQCRISWSGRCAHVQCRCSVHVQQIQVCQTSSTCPVPSLGARAGHLVHARSGTTGLDFCIPISLEIVMSGLPEILEQCPECLHSAQAKFSGKKKRTSPWQRHCSLT